MVDDDHRDRLPEGLDIGRHTDEYSFPDVSRRRIAAVIYVVAGTASLVEWMTHRGGGHVLVNRGFGIVGIALVALAGYQLLATWRSRIDDGEALVVAVRAIGFPVGHASAQLGWRGLRSRPTWRILLYSAENPPRRRGMVMIDAVDGCVVGQYVEDNPEDWTGLGGE